MPRLRRAVPANLTRDLEQGARISQRHSAFSDRQPREPPHGDLFAGLLRPALYQLATSLVVLHELLLQQDVSS